LGESPALACRVLLKIVYMLTCRILSLAVLVFRGDRAKDAELLALGEPEGALLGAQLLHPGGDGSLIGRIGIELGKELIPGVAVKLTAAHRMPSCFR
jgi:hypothetical protein